MLFNLYVNDPFTLNCSAIILEYADNTVAFYESQNLEDLQNKVKMTSTLLQTGSIIDPLLST